MLPFVLFNHQKRFKHVKRALSKNMKGCGMAVSYKNKDCENNKVSEELV